MPNVYLAFLLCECCGLASVARRSAAGVSDHHCASPRESERKFRATPKKYFAPTTPPFFSMPQVNILKI